MSRLGFGVDLTWLDLVTVFRKFGSYFGAVPCLVLM